MEANNETQIIPWSNEQLGVVFDALMEHRQSSLDRKAVNSESSSDERAGICVAIMEQITEECAKPQRLSLAEHDAAKDARIAKLESDIETWRRASAVNQTEKDARIVELEAALANASKPIQGCDPPTGGNNL